MSEEKLSEQIVRKDAKNCFVESLSDAFSIGKMHFNFASYDLTKPAGQRQTNSISIYISADEFLETAQYIKSYCCRGDLYLRKDTNDKKAVRMWLGGTSAEKLQRSGKPRADGMSLSRIAQIGWGEKTDVIFYAASGPGKTDEKGLIRPAFGNKPENRVLVPMTYDALMQLFLITEAHYIAWLSAQYMKGGTDNA